MTPDPIKNSILGAYLEERRRSTRFAKEPDTDMAVVWQRPGDEQLVSVHDESIHGICLELADVAAFSVDATAMIVYHSDLLEGVVRCITAQPDGKYLVSFECRRAETSAQT